MLGFRTKFISNNMEQWTPQTTEAATKVVLWKKVVLKIFTKLTGKHLCQSLFFNKVVCLRPATLLKKRLWHWCFPVNFVKFLRAPFLQNTSGQMLLDVNHDNYIS